MMYYNLVLIKNYNKLNVKFENNCYVYKNIFFERSYIYLLINEIYDDIFYKIKICENGYKNFMDFENEIIKIMFLLLKIY